MQALLSGKVATGTVVGHEVREIDDSQAFLPVVVFRDAGGVETRFTSVAGGSSRVPIIGTAVQVRYNPYKPDQAYISTFLHMWAAPLALGFLGLAVLSAARTW